MHLHANNSSIVQPIYRQTFNLFVFRLFRTLSPVCQVWVYPRNENDKEKHGDVFIVLKIIRIT